MVTVYCRLMDDGTGGPVNLVTRTPANEATEVSRGTSFSLIFNQAVTLGEGGIWLLVAGEDPIQATGVEAFGSEVVFSFERALDYGATYGITVDAEAVAGFGGIEEWTFTVEGQPDVVPPSDLPTPATHCEPIVGASGVTVNTDGYLYCWIFLPTRYAFSLSSGGAIKLVGPDGVIADAQDSLSWAIAQLPTSTGYVFGTRFDFRFRPTLEPGTGYGIRIPSGTIMLDVGQPWAGVTEEEWTFTSSGDMLQVTGLSPANIDLNGTYSLTDLSPVFEVAFNQAIRLDEEFRGTIELWKEGTQFVQAISPSHPSVSVSGTKLSWQFPGKLDPGTFYQVACVGPIVTTTAGQPWSGIPKAAWTFRTMSTDPSVLSAIAWDAPTGTWGTRILEIQFNRPIALTTSSSSDSPPTAIKTVIRIDGLAFAARATLSLPDTTTLRIEWTALLAEWGFNPANLQIHDFVATVVENLILDAETDLPWAGMQWRFSAMFQ